MRKLVILFISVVLFSCNNNNSLPQVSKKELKNSANYIECVNPMVGTKNMGHTFPGATTPFGMVQLSPTTNIQPLFKDGKYNKETASAMLQPLNDVVKPIRNKWLEDADITEKDLFATKQPSLEECEKNKLEPIYLSYFVPWNSHHNYEVAKRWGFQHLGHEYKREGTIEDYNSIDSITYLISEFLKYTKYGHSSTTQMASRWIRYGMVTREEMIPIVKKYDKVLDQGIIDKFCSFTELTIKEFYRIKVGE